MILTQHKRQQALPSIGTAVRFLLVGSLGTLLDLILFALLHSWLSLPVLLANMLSYSAGIINNYLLHRHWTYADQQHTAAGTQATRFVIVSLSALALNTALVLLLAEPLNWLLHTTTAGALLAKLIATGVGLIWNFLANHYWTFRTAHTHQH